MPRNDDIAADVIVAEAAAWLVRLQSPDRTSSVDAAFREWLRDPAHAQAFAQATEAWEIVPGAARLAEPSTAGGHKGRRAGREQIGRSLLAASLALAVLCAGVAAYVTRDPVYVTQVGQQQAVILTDGSRLTLNTDSRLVVAFSDAERRVRLERGEALFEVAKNPRRPFIVQVGGEQIRALGTTFTVRKDREKVAVVLLEGRVEITRRQQGGIRRVPVAVLTPGERLTLRKDTGVAVDRPKVEWATAWEQGEVMFDDTSLLDAVSELNRYGPGRVRIGDPEIASLRTSGVFQTHDPEEFAKTIAELHHLRVEQVGEAFVLKRR